MHLLVAVLLIFKYPAPSMTSDIQYVYEINEKKKKLGEIQASKGVINM